MKTGSKRLIIIIAALALIAIVVVAAGLRGNGKDNALTVSYYRVVTDSLDETISASGSFAAETTGTVFGKVTGAVTGILVEAGQRVSAGDALLTIDREDYLQAVRNSENALESVRRSALQNLLTMRSTYESASLSYSQAKRSVENNRELYQASGISEEMLKQSEDAFKTAELNLKSARERLNLTMGLPLTSEPQTEDSRDVAIVSAMPEVVQASLAVDTARRNLAHCTPLSPISGTVTQVMVKEGDLAAPNAPLVIIEDLNRMIAEIQIDEVDIGKIYINDSAEITSDSILGEVLSGRVKTISPVIQRVGNTRMSNVEVAIDPTQIPLKAGASCTARIAVTAKDAALVVPLTSYVTREDVSKVFVLIEQNEQDDGEVTRYTLEERVIETGVVTVNTVEVISGLSEGDLIAMGNQTLFREGLSVVLGEEK